MTNISLLLEKRKQYETKIKESTEKIDYAKKQKPIYCPQVFYNMILSIISLLSTLLLSMVAIFTPDVISKIVLFTLAGILSAISVVPTTKFIKNIKVENRQQKELLDLYSCELQNAQSKINELDRKIYLIRKTNSGTSINKFNKETIANDNQQSCE